jgi:Region found in RelA / SpoT proteins
MDGDRVIASTRGDRLVDELVGLHRLLAQGLDGSLEDLALTANHPHDGSSHSGPSSAAGSRAAYCRAVPRSLSKTQINKLGDRLRLASSPTAEDRDALEQLRLEYDPSLAEAQQIVESLGETATSRLKTVGTIIEKLRRDATRLSVMQDIAGLRIVKEMSLSEQTALANRIERAFGGGRVIDRRVSPSSGYRAVHAIVEVSGCPVEIQVRTSHQDQWAQLAERIADIVGRDIRYGALPPDPAGQVVAEVVLPLLLEFSEVLALREQGDDRSHRIDRELDHIEGLPAGPDKVDRVGAARQEVEELQEMRRETDTRREQLQVRFRSVIESLSGLSQALEQEGDAP